jgi:hypothetical protein
MRLESLLKIAKKSARTAGNPIGIETRYLSNRNLEGYRYTNLLGKSRD